MFGKNKICERCGYIGKPKKKLPGSMMGEIVLWTLGLVTLAFGIGAIILIIALIYSLYRLVGARSVVCPKCDNKDCFIPVDSAAGKQLLKKFELEEDNDEDYKD